MRVLVQIEDLRKVLSNVFHGLSEKTVEPIYSNILINSTKHELSLLSSNMDIIITSSLPKSDRVVIEKEGGILVSGKLLFDIISKLTENVVILETIDDSILEILCGKLHYRLNYISSDKYPLVDLNISGQKLLIKGDVLKKSIEQTKFAIASKKNITRPSLQGVHFKAENNKLELTGTDSFRLGNKTISISENVNFSAIVSEECLNALSPIFQEDNATIYISENRAIFASSNTVVYSRLINGPYPDTNRLIPQMFDYSLNIKKSTLYSTIEQVAVLASSSDSTIRLSLSTDVIELSSIDSKSQTAKVTLDDSIYIGGPLTINFRADYMLSVLRPIEEEYISIDLTGDNRPFTIKGKDSVDLFYLVLPIRTQS